MKNTAKFSCCIDTTDPKARLGIEIWLDGEQLFNVDHVDSTVDFSTEINDAEGEHEFQFVMKNKTIDHTQIDANGAIVKDACLILKNIEFEEIELGHAFIEKSRYTHDFNGTQELVETKFYREMGCNGTVSLQFTTPIYMWMLENL